MQVFISFIRVKSELFFEYGFAKETCVLNDFKTEFPSCETLEISTDKEEFFAEDAYDYLVDNNK